MVEFFPNDDNGHALQRMQSNGDDLSKPRDIDFSIVFSSEESAKSFVQKIISSFNNVEYDEVDTDDLFKWDVTATKFMIPNYNDILEMENYLGVLSEKFDGKIDGWGCFEI